MLSITLGGGGSVCLIFEIKTQKFPQPPSPRETYFPRCAVLKERGGTDGRTDGRMDKWMDILLLYHSYMKSNDS